MKLLFSRIFFLCRAFLIIQKLCKTCSYIGVTDLSFQKMNCFSDFSIGEQIKQIPSFGEEKERGYWHLLQELIITDRKKIVSQSLINCFAGQNLGWTFALMTQSEYSHLMLKKRTIIDVSTFECKKLPLCYILLAVMQQTVSGHWFVYWNYSKQFFAGLRIKETKEVYEGEVTELTPCETENPMGGYGKTISHVIIGLKTAKGTKQLKVCMAESQKFP